MTAFEASLIEVYVLVDDLMAAVPPPRGAHGPTVSGCFPTATCGPR